MRMSFALGCVIRALTGTLLASLPLLSRAAEPALMTTAADVSLQNEVQHAIDKGLAWLAANQNSNGFWSTPDQPAMTALALNAFMGDPSGNATNSHAVAVQKGYQFIVAHVQPDGGIYQKDLQNYNTSISMMALLAAHKPEYDPILRRARQWLVGQQTDFNEKGKIDSPYDGGIGYGGSAQHSDLNNTLSALEALHYSKYLEQDKNMAGAKDLNWAAAIHFIQNCQNLPAYNSQPWVSTNSADLGGFVYSPDESKAGPETNGTGRVALRSYGSISYAGLLSYVYCDLKRDDPRVTAVFNWLQTNYSMEENPGMGPQGYYYYMHLMAKGLSTYGVSTLELKDGTKVNWRRQLALKLINLQKADGSWANENNRWWEKDPTLVTSYSVMALEFASRDLLK